MTDITQTARRYLLGELTEAEQQAMEEAYFSDPQLFASVTAEESALIDEYVRGRLAPAQRQQFESVYLSRPERRARVAFAKALLTRVDAAQASSFGDGHGAEGGSWLGGWFGARGLSLAAGIAVVAIGIAVWATWQTARPQPDQQVQTNGSPVTPPVSPPPTPPPSVVTLALALGPGERNGGPGRPTALEIPPGTDVVRLALTLRERDYGRYRVLIRTIGGPEVLSRGDLRPTLEPSAPTFTIDVPAADLPSGDYILTLQGALPTGELDDLSQTIIRVR
jgi:hypothetical protein